ncbi:hypothetical protein [Piscinibacter sp.]|uniref:DODA-type extradiol aromatic ring-opening family dioxygenase n=1 Tax=Piscinibacter sp. TaxID=1903157 RepID=UPI0039E678F3
MPARPGNTALVCVSHSPIIMIRARAPAEEAELLAYYERCAARIDSFEPEQVVVFGTDHFAGFHLSTMPAHCVGLDAEAVDDIGGFPGRLAVPREQATALVQHLRTSDFDTAVSYKMRIDHGFSQPLKRLLGSHDRFPVIPVFIGALVQPYLPFRRSRLLGEAIGRFVASTGKRTLFMGSGGMSHHPTRYYPMVGEGAPDVAAYQLDGARGGTFSDEQWFRRIHDMHIEGAEMLVSGARTRADIRLNPQLDNEVLDALCAGRPQLLDDWDPVDLVQRAGIGFLELHTWVCATAAHLAAGGSAPSERAYAPTLEYGIGYGMVSADL